MELEFSRKKIVLNREEFAIDRFARKFAAHLEKLKMSYVFVSGYIAIAFGRSRNTEDVDLIVEKVPFPKFEKLWHSLSLEFECINAPSSKAAYEDYLQNGSAIRFALKGQFIPNVEFKFPKGRWDGYALENRVRLVLNGKPLFISPLELQIAFKGYLGSEKDLEDARFLYRLFVTHIDRPRLFEFMYALRVETENAEFITGKLK